MKTDVSGSMAGYYKQIHLAIRELLKLKDGDDSVGIECGADIRIFNTDGTRESIEAKFYKDKIGLYSPEIAKTIYNFYMETADDFNLTFNTNTEVPDSEFFEKSHGVYRLRGNQGLSYILHLLIKHSVSRNRNNNNIASHFQELNITCEKCGNNPCKNCINVFVRSFKDDYPLHFQEIFKINNVKLEEFLNKLQFVFENKQKEESISTIKKGNIDLLKQNYERTSELDEYILEALINKISMEFSDTTVLNSIIENPEKDYSTHKKISRNDVENLIDTYESWISSYTEDILGHKIIELIDDLDVEDENLIKEFEDEFREYKLHEENIKNLSLGGIKQYFIDKDLKFKSYIERDSLASKYYLYNREFGLIAYLMNLNFREIKLENDIMILKGKNKSRKIWNEDYYSFSEISRYISLNYKSVNEHYRYMELQECSFLQKISENTKDRDIQINGIGPNINLEEYQFLNFISAEQYEELIHLINSEKNILIISSVLKDTRPFLNGLISAIPKNKSFHTITEDLKSLPPISKENNQNNVDSLKVDYLDKMKMAAVGSAAQDICILLHGNYCTDINKHFEIYNICNKVNKRLIATLNRKMEIFNKLETFEEVSQKLLSSNNLCDSIFESYILIDEKIINDKKYDHITIHHNL